MTDSRWHQAAPPRQVGEPLPAYLQRVGLEDAVVIPCSDSTLREVAALAEGTRAYRTSVPSLAAAEALADKARFAQLLRRIGIPHPRTAVHQDFRDLSDSAFQGAAAGFFLKPRDSQRFSARFGAKAIWVESVDEAVSRGGALKGEGFEMILQEYIPGPASQHYFVDGFVDRDTVMRAAFVRQRLRMYPLDFGNSSHMISIRPDEAAEAIESLRTLTAELGYRGIFSAEFKRDARDGRFKLLEVNARPWWYIEFAARCRVDVTCMYYADALEKPVATQTDYAVGRSLTYPYYDFFACLAPTSGNLTGIWRWVRSLAASDYPVWAWDDPLPSLRAFGHWARAWSGKRRFTKRG